MHTHEKRTEKLPLRTLIKLKKNVVTRYLQPCFCFNSIDSKSTNRILEVLGIIPDVHRSKIHPETRYHDFGLHSLFPNSILIIHV